MREWDEDRKGLDTFVQEIIPLENLKSRVERLNFQVGDSAP